MAEPIEEKLPRVRRNRAEVNLGDVPLHEYPGPTVLPAPPKNASAEDREKHKARQTRFEINKVALQHYKSGLAEAKVNEKLTERYGVELPNGAIWRLAQRAQEINPSTGRIYGFWACVPNFRALPSLTRSSRPARTSRNQAHHLSAFFDRYPDIEAKLVTFVAKRTTGIAEMRKVPIVNIDKVWPLFLALCKEKQLHIASPREWPYSTASRGYEAIRRWLEGQRYLNPSQSAFNLLEESVAKAIRRDYAGVGLEPLAATSGMAYSRVELDEHEMDAMWTYLIQDDEGKWIAAPAGRMWVVVLLDTETTAALAGTVCFGPSFRKEDVLQTVYSALVAPPRPTRFRLDDPEWYLPPEAVFPSELPEFARCTWQQIALDLAASHRSPEVKAAIEDVTGCIASYDMPATPTARPIIELFFKYLARFAEWFESAVGNSPDSPVRRDPQRGAVESLVYVPAAHEILQMVLRIYNATPKKSLRGDSPIENLHRKRRDNQCFVSQIDATHNNLHRLLPKFEATLTRRHDPMFGPIAVNFGWTYYMGPELSTAQELMMTTDQKVDIYVQPDARFAVVEPRSAPERSYKVAVANRRWWEPHSLEMRKFYYWLGQHKRFAGKSELPQSGVAASRALAKAASTHEGFARLIGGHQAFYDLYGNGDVRCINLTPKECDELLAFVQRKRKEEGDECDDEGAEAPQTASAPPPSGPETTASDPYGLR
jgi:hypothetical protein